MFHLVLLYQLYNQPWEDNSLLQRGQRKQSEEFLSLSQEMGTPFMQPSMFLIPTMHSRLSCFLSLLLLMVGRGV